MEDRFRSIEESIRRLATVAEMQLESHDLLQKDVRDLFELQKATQMQVDATQRQVETTQRQLDYLSSIVARHVTDPSAHQ